MVIPRFILVKKQTMIVSLAAVLITLAPSVARGESPPFNPIGEQQAIVVPLRIAPGGATVEDCVPDPPQRKDFPSDAAFDAAVLGDGRERAKFAAMIDQYSKPVRKSAASWAGLLNGQVDGFFARTSYGRTRWDFRVLQNPDKDSADGWWPSPHTLKDYCVSYRKGGNNFDPAVSPVRDAVEGVLSDAAMTTPALAHVHRVVVLLNYRLHDGQSPVRTYSVNKQPVKYTVSFLPEFADDTDAVITASHELGHQLGLRDYYGPCKAPFQAFSTNLACAGKWDVMGPQGLTEFSAYSRVKLGYLPSVFGKVVELEPFFAKHDPYGLTLGLFPIENDGLQNVTRVLSIPFVKPDISAPGLVAECRRKINHDDIPTEGLVVRRVAEGTVGQGYTERAVDKDDPNQAMTRPGQALVRDLGTPATPHVVEITYNGFVDAAGACSVSVREHFTAPAPALSLDAGTAFPGPARISGVAGVGSTGIWVDSPKNGFGQYPSEQKVVRIGTERVPLGPGDPQWEHHVNRIRFRVRNVGDGVARDVRVQVSASSVIPLVSGCAARRGVAAATIPSIEAGATAVGSVPWVPADDGPVQLEVNVQSPEGEPPLLPHTARSTTAIASVRWQGRRTQVQTVKVRVPRECGVASVAPVVLQTVKGWRIDVRPRFALPGARRTFRIRARALPGTRPGVAKPTVIGFSVETLHGIQPPVGQGAPPVGDDNAFTFSAGLSLRPSLVVPSSVSLQCNGRARAGDPLSVTGRISPPIAHRVVALEVQPPSGQAFVWTAKTRRDGRFQRSQHLRGPGRWTIQAARQQDGRNAGAVSPPCHVTVLP